MKNSNTYLSASFKDKDTVKALGAQWDAAQKLWFVPTGRDLAPFSNWLSQNQTQDVLPLTTIPTAPTLPTTTGPKGVSLSTLLSGVSQAVTQAYKTGIWTLVEVVELRTNGGHVYLSVSERNAHGAVLAKSNAVIWQSCADTILPEFQRATGAQLAPGIKLLVRARPVFKSQYGFSLEIDAIDPEYTLGDLEARKRAIRARLQAEEGVFEANKQLAAPWDFTAVLVIAPPGGAGLGDFQAEANRLEQCGVCRFTYAYSRFQGEGAAKDICDTLQQALTDWPQEHDAPPDGVVLIRGGGAVNDLAWLNEYDLARLICDLPIPVFTGIGHERDNTVIDEVAHTRFDTPSKVIAGIEQAIVQRTAEAKSHFALITHSSALAAEAVKSSVTALECEVRAQAARHIATSHQNTSEALSAIRLNATTALQTAATDSKDVLQAVKTHAATNLATAKREVPLFYGQITLGSQHALKSCATAANTTWGAVMERCAYATSQARVSSAEALDKVTSGAQQHLRGAATQSESLLREITGQGPEKTLRRGFALVRLDGKPLTRAHELQATQAVEIQFFDGKVTAIASNQP